MRFLPGVIFFLFLVVPALSAATEDAQALSAARVISGDELTLADGRILHLEGIGEPFAGTKDLRDKARQVLQDLTAGRQLAVEDVSTDRYGRISAQAYALDARGGKTWLQGEMLKQGVAFIYPPTGNEARLDEMQALEAAARKTETGIWADAAYADVPSDKAAGCYGRFAFVSGNVLDVSRAKGTVYIHFGKEWRWNLTVAIAAHDLYAFRDTNAEPFELQGKTVRVRGWVKRDIGPMIMVTSPRQVDLLPTER